MILILIVIRSPGEKNDINRRAALLTPEESQWLDENPDKLTLYYNVEFPPIEFADSEGNFTGMGADIISKIEEILDIEFIKIPSNDWLDHLKALESGYCAIAPTIVRTAERERYAFFTRPYASVPVIIITTQKYEERLTLGDLRGLRVGVVSGYATENYLLDMAILKQFEVVPLRNVPSGLETVAFGQIDAFVENLAVAAYYIEKHGIPNLRVSGITDYYFDWSIGISRHYPLLYSSIEKALESIPEKELDIIRKKWISLETGLGMDAQTILVLKLTGTFIFLLLLSLTLITMLLKVRLRQKVKDLKNSEERYRRIAENSPAAVFRFRMDKEGKFSFPYISEASHKITGHINTEIMSDASLLLERIHPDDKKEFLDRIYESARKLCPYQGHGRFFKENDPDYIWIEVQATIEKIPDGSVIWNGFFHDITRRKKAEEETREREEKFRALAENSPDMIMRFNKDFSCLYVNSITPRKIRVGIEDLQGKKITESGFPKILKGIILDLLNSIFNSSEIQHIEFQLPDKSWVDCLGVPEFDDKGQVRGAIISSRDITRRKMLDEERITLQDRLIQSQKMESIGKLAGGVAHDFNNMLGVILGYTEIAMLHSDPENKVYANLMEIRKATERSAELTAQLLAFARKQATNPKTLDLNEAVEGMLKMLRRLIGEHIDMAWLPSKASCMINIDPAQINQVLANLCVNARDAIAESGRIEIETDIISLNDQTYKKFNNAYPGEFVVLSIKDNGCGMDRETISHLFEPFFTTKEQGKGTGLGLCTVYGIVGQNKGFINVVSKEGQGSTFSIFFPRHQLTEKENEKGNNEANDNFGRETILIVEDEKVILNLTKEMLSSYGYNILLSEKPEDALKTAANLQGEIDLLITDVIMPVMNGRELANKILKICPDIKILFMSGYTSEIISRHGVLNKGINYIQKPFSMNNFAQKVREVLKDTK